MPYRFDGRGGAEWLSFSSSTSHNSIKYYHAHGDLASRRIFNLGVGVIASSKRAA